MVGSCTYEAYRCNYEKNCLFRGYKYIKGERTPKET